MAFQNPTNEQPSSPNPCDSKYSLTGGAEIRSLSHTPNAHICFNLEQTEKIQAH